VKKADLTELANRLTELAEALQGKAPAGGGLKVWLDALTECDMNDVRAVLTDWPKNSSRMPAPNEVLKACRTVLSERLEKQAAENAKDARKPFDPARLRPSDPNDPEYLNFRKWFRDDYGKREPRADHKEWAKTLRVREECGEVMLPIQREKWRGALGYPQRATLEEITRLDG
jgi:hypothetical protein